MLEQKTNSLFEIKAQSNVPPSMRGREEELKRLYKTPENFMKVWEKEMTDEDRKLLCELDGKVSRLEKEAERVYHYWVELPDWAAPTIHKLVDKGYYYGGSDADLNLPESLMRVLVINDRGGLYE